jgi:hypothetical protein
MASKRARQEAPQHDDWTLKYAANLSDDIFGSRTGVVRNILWLLEIPIELLENIGEYIGRIFVRHAEPSNQWERA